MKTKCSEHATSDPNPIGQMRKMIFFTDTTKYKKKLGCTELCYESTKICMYFIGVQKEQNLMRVGGCGNISFILFCKRGIKDYLWDSLDHRKPRSKKFANFTTTRLRWNSYKFLPTISYEISWSTNKTSFYTRKICIFSVDLFTEMRYESDPAQRCRDNSAGSKLGHCTRGCVPLDFSKKRPQKTSIF